MITWRKDNPATQKYLFRNSSVIIVFICNTHKTKAAAYNSQHRKVNACKVKLPTFFFFLTLHRSPRRNFSKLRDLPEISPRSPPCHFLGVFNCPYPTTRATWFSSHATSELRTILLTNFVDSTWTSFLKRPDLVA